MAHVENPRASWDRVLADPKVDEIAVYMKNGRTLLRWKYPNGPKHYRWFDF